jgi:hypothetical protein
VVVLLDLVAVALSPSELIRLEEEYGSLEAAAEALPDQREEILAAADRVGEISRKFREAVSEISGKFRETVGEARQQAPPSALRPPPRPQIPDFDLDELQTTQEAMEAALVAVGLGERQKGDPGAREKDFAGALVEDAVRMWKLRETHDPPTSQNAIAERTGLSRAAVRRIVRLVAVGALEWDKKRGPRWLGIDGQFRATPSTISLRALEKAHGLVPLA